MQSQMIAWSNWMRIVSSYAFKTAQLVQASSAAASQRELQRLNSQDFFNLKTCQSPMANASHAGYSWAGMTWVGTKPLHVVASDTSPRQWHTLSQPLQSAGQFLYMKLQMHVKFLWQHVIQYLFGVLQLRQCCEGSVNIHLSKTGLWSARHKTA